MFLGFYTLTLTQTSTLTLTLSLIIDKLSMNFWDRHRARFPGETFKPQKHMQMMQRYALETPKTRPVFLKSILIQSEQIVKIF